MRGRAKEGWDVDIGGWVSKAGAVVAGRRGKGTRGAERAGEVVCRYLPVMIEDERFNKAGVRVSV